MSNTLLQKHDEILKLFTSKNGSRKSFAKPFFLKGKTHATDMYTLATLEQMETLIYDELESNLDLTNVLDGGQWEKPVCMNIHTFHKFIDKAQKVNEWTETKDSDECDECNGMQYKECDLGHEHDCDHCNGSGVYPPTRRTGKQIPDPDQSFSFKDSCLAGKYLQRIEQVAVILNETTIQILGSKGNKAPFHFKVGTVLITIMPLSRIMEDTIPIIK